MGERLIRAAAGQDAVQVVGVWDPSVAILSRLETEIPGLPIMRSAADVIERAECIYVASPPATHLAHAETVLTHGKALFCEKPLAVDVREAALFVQTHGAARAAVNFPFASSPAVASLTAWLADAEPRGASIEVAFAAWPRGWQHAAASWLDGREQGGFTREVLSHFLFLARRLFGPLTLEHASTFFAEASRSERGITAQIKAGTVPLTVRGDVGTTDAEDTNSFTVDDRIRLRNWSIAERKDGTRWLPDPAALPQDRARPLVLQRQLAAVAAMTHGEPHPLATLTEALDVQRIVEAILLA